MVPDSELIGRIVDRDREAFGLFYDRHASVLFGLCVRILRDSRDAEDVMQEVFLQVWNESERFDPSRASIRTWLFTIARSRALDRYRSRKSVDQRMAGAVEGLPDPAGDDLEKASLLRRYMTQQVAKLSEAEQKVLSLAYYEGFTQEEIARRLNEPLGTVKSRARSALTKLHSLLSGEHKNA